MYQTYWEALDLHLSSCRVPYPSVEPSPILVRATYVKSIAPAVARILVEPEVPENCFHAFVHLGGAISDYSSKETAFFHSILPAATLMNLRRKQVKSICIMYLQSLKTVEIVKVTTSMIQC